MRGASATRSPACRATACEKGGEMREDRELVLRARVVPYGCFQALFGSEPTDAVMAPLATEDVYDVMNVFARQDEKLAAVLDALRSAALALTADGRDVADVLGGLYGRLFVGPGTIEAAPWESAHLAAERMLFQASTLEVRKAYVQQGLIPQNYPHVADDHLAIELDFMRLLARRAADAFCKGDEPAAAESLQASQRFLGDHLLAWAPSLCRALEVSAPESVYAKAACVLERFMKVDRDVLCEIQDAVALPQP